MSTETLKDKVIFGRSATEETIIVSYATSCKITEQSAIKITKRSLTGIQTGYKKLDLSDQKKKDTCRKLNKMMGGY